MRPRNYKGSHPVWVRGLKHAVAERLEQVAVSHPVWVRGLKQLQKIEDGLHRLVAPRVGAWIETNPMGSVMSNRCVAPRVGAWIETARKMY